MLKKLRNLNVKILCTVIPNFAQIEPDCLFSTVLASCLLLKASQKLNS